MPRGRMVKRRHNEMTAQILKSAAEYMDNGGARRGLPDVVDAVFGSFALHFMCLAQPLVHGHRHYELHAWQIKGGSATVRGSQSAFGYGFDQFGLVHRQERAARIVTPVTEVNAAGGLVGSAGIMVLNSCSAACPSQTHGLTDAHDSATGEASALRQSSAWRVQAGVDLFAKCGALGLFGRGKIHGHAAGHAVASSGIRRGRRAAPDSAKRNNAGYSGADDGSTGNGAA